MSFSNFLKDIDINLHKSFILETFKESNNYLPSKKDYIHKIVETKKYIPNIFSGLPLVRECVKDSEIYQFCNTRKLPIDTFPFYFAANFNEWTKGNTDKFIKCTGKDHSRLIIPWYDRDKKIIGYSARDLDNTQDQKYYRIFVDDEAKEKFFGIDRLDDSKSHFVCEGEIDSLSIDNAIAVSNGKLSIYQHPNAHYIPDGDYRNKQIMKNTSDLIEAGYKVCLLPDNLPKDLNEMMQNGLTKVEITDIIHQNTFQGISARMRFNTLKRI